MGPDSTLTKNRILNMLRAEDEGLADHYQEQLKDFPMEMKLGLNPTFIAKLKLRFNIGRTTLVLFNDDYATCMTTVMPTHMAAQFIEATNGAITVMVPK